MPLEMLIRPIFARRMMNLLTLGSTAIMYTMTAKMANNEK
jgi:hypothetical protein